MNDSKQADIINGARHGTALFTITAIIVFLLFVSAFILSYDALLNLARDNGINERFSILWPLGLDAFMAAASLAVIWASINQLKAHWFRVLVGLAVLASIVGNILHANNNLVSRGIAALPPIVAFLSFEVLMVMVRHETTRAGLRSTLDHLLAEIDQTRSDYDTALADLDTLREQSKRARDRKRTLDAQVMSQKRLADELAAAGGDPKVARQMHIMSLLQSTNGNPPTQDELLAQLKAAGYDISLSTLKRDLGELEN